MSLLDPHPGVPDPGDATAITPGLMSDRRVYVIFAIILTALVGVASITPAFPAVMLALDVSAQEVGLVITVFALPGVALAPVAGLLADRIGRRAVLLPLLVTFALGGLGSGLAPSFDLLLVFRFVQGIGASGLFVIGATLVGDLYAGADRARIAAYQSSVTSIAALSLPAIGGFMAALGWCYPFLLSLIALPVALLAVLWLPELGARRRETLWRYLAETASLLADRRLIGAVCAGLMTFVVLYGAFLVTFTLLMTGRGASIPEIGLLTASISAFAALASANVHHLLARASRRKLIVSAFVLAACGTALVPHVPGLWPLLLPSAIYGTALGISFPLVHLVMLEVAPTERRGGVMAINGMLFRTGQVIGPLLMALVLTVAGMKAVFAVGGLMLLATALVLAVTIRD